MQKFVTLIFAILACSALGITVWVSWEGESFYQEAANRFQSETGIEVNLVYFPKIEDKLNIALKTGDLPDLALIKDTYTGNIGASRRAVRIDPSDLSGFEDKYLQAYSWNGNAFGMPYYADLQVAFLNRRVFAAAGVEVPKSLDFEDLPNIYSELKRVVDYPIAFDFTSPYMMFPYISIDSQPIDTNGRPLVFSMETVMAVSKVKSYFDSGVISRLERGALNGLFRDGKIGIMLQGSYLAPRFRSAGLDFEMLSLPDLEGAVVSGVIDSKGFVFFNEKTYSGSVRFARYLIENSESFYEEFAKYPLLSKLEGAAEIDKIIDKGQFIPNHPGYQTILFESFEKALQMIFSGRMSIEDSLIGAQGYIDSMW
jgi:ABC-type glycerol-3-phosphate transport system substrate-binding protein